MAAPDPRDAGLPRPYDRDAAERLKGEFAALGAAERALAATDAGAALLGALGGHSPFLSDLALRFPAALLRMTERGPDDALALALDPLSRAEPATPRAAIGGLLRRVKGQVALIAAAADIAGLWTLDKVTGALSTLAEASLDLALAHLLREAAARGDLRLPGRARRDAKAVARGSGLAILGMGKLGARELNYSSDIDLMVLFDPEVAAYQPERANAVYVRIARDLVTLMEERTAEGYVFRTDLRLRPDPAATPLAVSIPAAIGYYGSMGQNWERAAMIKARTVAGDRALGEGFLREIRPFIWRRHLDFAAVADIHAMKRQIHAHKGASGANATVQVAGHDVKLGRGGIREIEFTVQVLQLIWGGRDPGLRDPTTLGGLATLANAGRIERRAAADLADAYVFLRQVEHRLQMVADRQTHRLPEDAEGLARIASFLGYADGAAFSANVIAHLSRVERHYGGFFESAPTLAEGERGSLVFTGIEDDPATIATLAGMGFRNPSGVAAMVRGWHHGRTRATRSERARELLTALMPALLGALARQREPDAALQRFDAVLAKLPAGVQVLSLLARNTPLLDRLAGILGAAPQLADHLARNTAALEGLLSGSPGSLTAASCVGSLPALVKDARHVEEAMAAARRGVVERNFEIDAAALEGLIDPDVAGEARSDLAAAALASLLPHVVDDFSDRHGRVKGGALAIVALGKLGGREMLPGSDLDLVLIYDHDPAAEASQGGPRALPVPQYYARLANQVVAAITAPGPEGRLGEVDMRLRPSGSKGPVAVSLAAFTRYHLESAWTWERMALTRARVVAGPAGLARRINAAIRAALTREGVATAALADAAAMRARLARDKPAHGPWDVKLIAGGLVEVEFIAQSLQLAHANRTPGVLATQTRAALAALARHKVLDAEEAHTLIASEKLWRTVSGLLRLTIGTTREADLGDTVAHALLHVTGPVLPRPAVDLAELRQQMQEQAEAVRGIFLQRIGPMGNGA